MKFNPHIAYASATEQTSYQSAAFRSLLRYLKLNSGFYRQRFSEHNIDIANIKSTKDITFLPTTSKEDIQERNWEFLCVQEHQVREYTATIGSKGWPVTIALTAHDLERLAYIAGQSFLCAGGRQEDIYQLMLPMDRQFMAGLIYYQGVHKLGAALIRTGNGLPAFQWDTINRLQCNSLVGVPSFLLEMAGAGIDAGIDLKHTPVKKALCIGESIRQSDFELNALGRSIVTQWPITLFGSYVNTEVQAGFTECAVGMGMHEQPDTIISEVLDEQDHPLPPGAYGELTITTLGIQGMPLLRYRTGDICTWYDKPCTCGRRSKRISPIIGRKKQMIKYQGTTLYPNAITEVLNSIDWVNDYIIEADTNDLGMDDLRLHVLSSINHQQAEKMLAPLLQAKLRVLPTLHFVSEEAINRMKTAHGLDMGTKLVDLRDNIAL